MLAAEMTIWERLLADRIGPLPTWLFWTVFTVSATVGIVVEASAPHVDLSGLSSLEPARKPVLFAISGIAIALVAKPTLRQRGLFKWLTLICLPLPCFEFGKTTASLPADGALVALSSLGLFLAPVVLFSMCDSHLRDLETRPKCLVPVCRGYCLPVTVHCSDASRCGQNCVDLMLKS